MIKFIILIALFSTKVFAFDAEAGKTFSNKHNAGYGKFYTTYIHNDVIYSPFLKAETSSKKYSLIIGSDIAKNIGYGQVFLSTGLDWNEKKDISVRAGLGARFPIYDRLSISLENTFSHGLVSAGIRYSIE